VTYLVEEVLLRLAKAAVALLLGLVLFGIATGLAGEPASASLFLLCWLSGAAFVLLVESNPIG
jgi:hypothetical protein